MSIKHHEPQGESRDPEGSPETTAKDATQAVSEGVSPSADDGKAAPNAPDSGYETKIAALESELASVREELSSVNDKYLRKLADDVNFRKRMAREKEDGQRFAVAALLGDLIPVLDDFDRAVASAEVLKEYTVLHDGIVLIRRQLGQVLESKYGLKKLESLGALFDPNHHEAVAMVQGGPEDGDEAVVAEEFLPGYGLHDRILRTAKVRVRMPAPRQSPGQTVADAAAGPDAGDTGQGGDTAGASDQ